MFRKMTLALIAATSLGAAALAPSAASAGGFYIGHGPHWGCVVRRRAPKPSSPGYAGYFSQREKRATPPNRRHHCAFYGSQTMERP